METTIEGIPAMYVISPNGPKGAPDAFKKLEDAIKWELKGRKFYGTELNNEYRANLAFTDPEEPKKLGFETWIIPGGKYFKDKIPDWEKNIPEIGRKCEEIRKKINYDETRPIIEFYRSQKELFLFVPMK